MVAHQSEIDKEIENLLNVFEARIGDAFLGENLKEIIKLIKDALPSANDEEKDRLKNAIFICNALSMKGEDVLEDESVLKQIKELQTIGQYFVNKDKKELQSIGAGLLLFAGLFFISLVLIPIAPVGLAVSIVSGAMLTFLTGALGGVALLKAKETPLTAAIEKFSSQFYKKEDEGSPKEVISTDRKNI